MTIEQLITKLNTIVGPNVTYDDLSPYPFYDIKNDNIHIYLLTREQLYESPPYNSPEALKLVKTIINFKGDAIRKMNEGFDNN